MYGLILRLAWLAARETPPHLEWRKVLVNRLQPLQTHYGGFPHRRKVDIRRLNKGRRETTIRSRDHRRVRAKRNMSFVYTSASRGGGF